MKKNIALLLFIIVTFFGTNVLAWNNPMIGKWEGVVSTPWTTPYNVKFEFRSDGTYSSEALGPTCGTPQINKIGIDCQLVKLPALYYGTDGYNEKKHYDVKLNEKDFLVGNITIFFEETNTAIPTTFQSISIRKIENSRIGTYLDFSFMYKKENDETLYGPLKYTLKKIPQ